MSWYHSLEANPQYRAQRKIKSSKNKRYATASKELGNYGHHVDPMPSGGRMRLVSTGPPRNADTGLNNDSHRPLLAREYWYQSRHSFPGTSGRELRLSAGGYL